MASINVKRLRVAAGFVIATLLVGGIAVAAPADDIDTGDLYTSKVLVSTHGLDLSSPVDQALLQQRIERASRRVCGLFEPGASSSSEAYIECHKAAIADASGQLKVLVARATGGTLLATR